VPDRPSVRDEPWKSRWNPRETGDDAFLGIFSHSATFLDLWTGKGAYDTKVKNGDYEKVNNMLLNTLKSFFWVDLV